MLGEQFDTHLGDFPAGQIEMDAVDKGHVVADHIRHGGEQVADLHHHIDGLVGIAEHDDAGVAGVRILAPLEGARLAVGLHGGDDFLGHLLKIGHLVKPHHVPDRNHPFLAPRSCARTCWPRWSARSAVRRTGKFPG